MTRSTAPCALAIALFAALFACPKFVRAEGHPEHPEHPAEAKQAQASLTMEELGKAITAYVENDTRLKGGFFLVYDPVAKQPLALKLDHVHQEKLASLGNEVYFACADFKTDGGIVYDLDVFMKMDEGSLQTTEISVHKQAGQPRYNWKEAEGVWTREKVK